MTLDVHLKCGADFLATRLFLPERPAVVVHAAGDHFLTGTDRAALFARIERRLKEV